MTDDVAVLDGFTDEYLADCDMHSMHILVKPDTDFDSRFTAWSTDDQEYIRINGWNWTFERTN